MAQPHRTNVTVDVLAMVMPRFVLLTKFTRSGIANVRDSPERTVHAAELVESVGGSWEEFFITMGRFDGVVIADFPDDESAATAVLSLAGSGNVSIEPLRAFNLDEFRALVETLP